MSEDCHGPEYRPRTDERYSLTEAAGLNTILGHHLSPESPGYTGYVRAADVEAMLAKAPVVYGNTEDGWMNKCPSRGTPDDWHTHTARIIAVSPVVNDTAESLLRELVGAGRDFAYLKAYDAFVDRARKLLEGG